MFNRKQKGSPGYTLILGAGASISSECPSFYDLCAKYCTEKSLILKNNDHIFTVKDYIRTQSLNRIDDYSWFSTHLKGRKPSLGYAHLVNLIKQGYFKTIITLNFDCLLENAIIKQMGLDDVKILVRGEITDDVISNFLECEFPDVRIVKMHGDLSSGIFFITDAQTANVSPALTSTLGGCLVKGAVIVGSSMNDYDVLHLLLAGKCQSVVYVDPKDPSETPMIQSKLQTLTDKQLWTITGDDGNFDRFFTDLDIEVQNCRCDVLTTIHRALDKIEENIIKNPQKIPKILTMTDWIKSVDDFTREINKFKPDCLVFIEDPDAPGGMRLQQALKKDFEGKVKICTIKIAGITNSSRYHERAVQIDKEKLQELNDTITEDVHNILVLDAIAFSGNTLHLALKELKALFPNNFRRIRAGVVYLSKYLHESISNLGKESPLDGIIYEHIIDRHDLFFPWGLIQPTNVYNRFFSGIEECDEYNVEIKRTKWGSIELLTDKKCCSVRILTIDANRTYSLQRHLCRDEFFIPLDDNVNLEICSKNLSAAVSKSGSSYSNVSYINSIVLEKGDYILIPRGMWHRFRANQDPVRLLEIGYGVYDDIADIQRI